MPQRNAIVYTEEQILLRIMRQKSDCIIDLHLKVFLHSKRRNTTKAIHVMVRTLEGKVVELYVSLR